MPHDFLVPTYRLFMHSDEDEEITPIWRGTGLEMAFMNVEQHEQAIGRLKPNIFLQGNTVVK